MKYLNKKILGLAVVAAALPMSVMAASTTIDATATFRQAITLNNETAMDFGQVDFSGTPAGGDTVTMSPDGSMVSAGNFSGAATGTAGSVDIATGTDGLIVDIRCDASAVLTDGAGASIQVTSISVAAGDDTATVSNCAGTGSTAMSLTLDSGTANRNQVKLGGVLDGSTATSFVGGSYSTANAGGDTIAVDIIYQ